MKNSIFVKFIAIALCAAALLAATGGGLGILLMAQNGLYDRSTEEILADEMEGSAYNLSQQIAQNYASTNLGGCPDEMLSHYHYLNEGYYGYTLRSSSGAILEQHGITSSEGATTFTFAVDGSYMKVQSMYPETVVVESLEDGLVDNISDDNVLVYQIEYSSDEGSAGMDSREPLGVVGHTYEGYATFASVRLWNAALEENPLLVTEIAFYDEDRDLIYWAKNENGVGWLTEEEDGLVSFIAASPRSPVPVATEKAPAVEYFGYYDHEQKTSMVVEYTWEVMPEYLVTMTVLPGAVYNSYYYTMADTLTTFRDWYPWALGLGLLLFAITAVYLCCAAGRRPGTDEVRPAGFNRIPLDLYLCGAGGLLCALLLALVEGGGALIDDQVMVGIGFMALVGYAMALVVVAYCYAVAAQVKSKGGYWWRHMVLGWAMRQVLRFFRWLGRGLKWLRNGTRAVFNLLPVMWQWLVTAAVMVLLPMIFFLLAYDSYSIFELFWGVLCILTVVADVAMVIYGGWCVGTLLKGVRNMAQGNLNQQIRSPFLFGIFGQFAEALNHLAEGARMAAERQMKSERMKTELITNVSHDIKTPLTSIINYVDLLKKPQSQGEGDQYLNVLDRQSQRLKKLIDDLMEMSKASTGNLTVELGQVDAVEAVNQALGEFSDKLAVVNLSPVFRHPEEAVNIRADGRLLWRVMSNLLSNACKYALPDTRLYIDLMMLNGNAVITIKNISREQLNVGAEELMERFVRGDASRNTEGSGLGLNIARSLVELQNGQMHLMVDGDLFKATLIFPLW